MPRRYLIQPSKPLPYLSTPPTCPACGGSGGCFPSTCARCGGTGSAK